jgi:hypothetical protein
VSVSSMVSCKSAAARIVGSDILASFGEAGWIFDEMGNLVEPAERRALPLGAALKGVRRR